MFLNNSCLSDDDLTDVTLASYDDLQKKAHKIILLAPSTFFRNLLINNSGIDWWKLKVENCHWIKIYNMILMMLL